MVDPWREISEMKESEFGVFGGPGSMFGLNCYIVKRLVKMGCPMGSIVEILRWMKTQSYDDFKAAKFSGHHLKHIKKWIAEQIQNARELCERTDA